VHQRLEKEPDLQAKQRKQDSSILLIDFVLSFVSFGRIVGEIWKRMSGVEKSSLHLEDFHSFILMKGVGGWTGSCSGG
jgi:hypothetical protein